MKSAKIGSLLVTLCLIVSVTPTRAGVDHPPGQPLSASQLKKELIGRRWEARWGHFGNYITFSKAGIFDDGITTPRRWHFNGDKVCIASGHPNGAYPEWCLDFFDDGDGTITSWLWSNEYGQFLKTYYGPRP